MNYYLEDFCCFCLNISNEKIKTWVLKGSDNLSVSDKIKTTLVELSAVIKTNCRICKKCSETIDSIYDFSKTCLKNMEILSSYKKLLKENLSKKRCDLYVDLSKSNQCKKTQATSMESSLNKDDILYETDFVSHSHSNKFTVVKDEIENVNSTVIKIEPIELPSNNNEVSLETAKVKEEFEMNYETCNEESETSWPHCEVKIEIDDTDLKEKQLNEIVGLKDESLKSNTEDFKKIPVSPTEDGLIKKENTALTAGHFLEPPEKKPDQTLSNEKPYKCDICKKSFNYKHTLKTHILIHTGEKPYKCNICDKLFSQHTGLKYHMLTHTTKKQFKCNICEKSFKQQSTLKAHMIIHTEEKPYKCHICGQLFNHKPSLDNHMIKHTGERPHKCHICNKQYIRKRSLTIHMLTHMADKHYKCDFCLKLFHHESVLKKHMLIHSEEKFTCDICGKFFNLSCNLKTHMLIHTGEKSHKCDVCGKLFSRKSNLKQHMLTHKGLVVPTTIGST